MAYNPIAIVCILVIASCTPIDEHTRAVQSGYRDDYISPLGFRGMHLFLSTKQPIIHLGNQQNHANDAEVLEAAQTTVRFFGQYYTWPFTMSRHPERVTVIISIRPTFEEKSSQASHCPTVLLINEATVVNLWDVPIEHYKDLMLRIVPLPIDNIARGMNTLTVRANTCPEQSAHKPAHDAFITFLLMEIQ